MIGPSVDFAFAACADDVARAILLVAKKRATAMDALLLVRLSRIKWRVRPLRVARHSTFVRQRLVVIRAIPIATPFPDVAGHVVKTVAVWRKRFHRCDAFVTVFARILHWKFSLPRVGHPFSAGTKIIAPDVRFSLQPAARRKFKLRFGRQTFTCPFRISFCVRVRDVHDRIVLLAFDVALRPKWMTPVRAFHVGPPLIMIVEWNFLIRRREDDCTSYEILLGRSWELLSCWFAFSDGDVIRRLNELPKLRIGHRSRIHQESIYVYTIHLLSII